LYVFSAETQAAVAASHFKDENENEDEGPVFATLRRGRRGRLFGPAKPFRPRSVCYTLSAMPVPPDPDAVLMLRVKRGDRAAFTGLVEKYKQPVLNFIYRSLRDETEAEDLAQNVFFQV
jgi:hypothetical protein